MPESFTERVEARLAPFDPDADKFDEATGEELKKLYPLTIPRPMTKPAGPVPDEFNEGAFEAWVWHPEENDWAKHSGSIDPRTNMLLKGMKHPTIQKAVEYEASQGREFVKADKEFVKNKAKDGVKAIEGRYYLQDKKK